MSLDTAINLVMAWCAVITVIGACVAWAGRVIRKRIQLALKDVQTDLAATKQALELTRRRHIAVLVYARRLYDTMVRAQINPPEPPAEFYEQ